MGLQAAVEGFADGARRAGLATQAWPVKLCCLTLARRPCHAIYDPCAGSYMSSKGKALYFTHLLGATVVLRGSGTGRSWALRQATPPAALLML